jgi:hypothetical protein
LLPGLIKRLKQQQSDNYEQYMMIKENNKIFPFRFKKFELIFPRLTSRTMAGRFVCVQAGDLERERESMSDVGGKKLALNSKHLLLDFEFIKALFT